MKGLSLAVFFVVGFLLLYFPAVDQKAEVGASAPEIGVVEPVGAAGISESSLLAGQSQIESQAQTIVETKTPTINAAQIASSPYVLIGGTHPQCKDGKCNLAPEVMRGSTTIYHNQPSTYSQPSSTTYYSTPYRSSGDLIIGDESVSPVIVQEYPVSPMPGYSSSTSSRRVFQSRPVRGIFRGLFSRARSRSCGG